MSDINTLMDLADKIRAIADKASTAAGRLKPTFRGELKKTATEIGTQARALRTRLRKAFTDTNPVSASGLSLLLGDTALEEVRSLGQDLRELLGSLNEASYHDCVQAEENLQRATDVANMAGQLEEDERNLNLPRPVPPPVVIEAHDEHSSSEDCLPEPDEWPPEAEMG